MTEDVTSVSKSGDGPETKLGSPSKRSDTLGDTLSSTIHSSAFNTSGALQQLSELLNMHARGGTMSEFKGDLTISTSWLSFTACLVNGDFGMRTLIVAKLFVFKIFVGSIAHALNFL